MSKVLLPLFAGLAIWFGSNSAEAKTQPSKIVTQDSVVRTLVFQHEGVAFKLERLRSGGYRRYYANRAERWIVIGPIALAAYGASLEARAAVWEAQLARNEVRRQTVRFAFVN